MASHFQKFQCLSALVTVAMIAEASPTRVGSPPFPPLRAGNDPSDHCPQYHSFRGDQDPSGPLQTSDGVWHVFPINENWSHCTSSDLLRWNCSHPSTGWKMPNTGGVSATPAGFFAMQADNFNVSMARANGPDLDEWVMHGVVASPRAPYPATMSLSDTGRALQRPSGWYVPVGVRGPGNVGGGVHWFRADNESLTHLVEASFLFTTNTSLGPLLECPDVFELGGKAVLLGSFPGPDSCYSCGTSWWWVGSFSADDLTFTPEATGRFDFGMPGFSSIYAAKSGSQAAAPFSRRVLFGFGGWRQGDMSSCGGRYVLPRDLSLSPAGALLQHPAAELEGLRQGPAVEGATIAAGGQVEVLILCTLPAAGPPSSGVLGVETLQQQQQAAGAVAIQVGIDFASRTGFAFVPAPLGLFGNTSRTDSTAPLQSALQGDTLEIRVFVDGQMVETFFGGEASITTATSSAAASSNITSALINTASLACNVTSWVLSL